MCSGYIVTAELVVDARKVILLLSHCVANFCLDFLTGQFDKTISDFVIKLLISRLHYYVFWLCLIIT